MKKLKTTLFFWLFIVCFTTDAQKSDSAQVAITGTPAIPAKWTQTDEREWERPFNFFAAAGASFMFGDHYTVAVSPIDRTLQFEKTFPLLTRFSLGLVWNPLTKDETASSFQNNKLFDKAYKIARNHLAVALLVNVLQLSFSSEFSSSNPIDVGFGLGYRNKNFLILWTIELTPLRTPRQYIQNQYLDKNLTMTLAGAKEPVTTLNLEDNSIFVSKIFPSIGVKVAYSFSKEQK